MEVKRTEGGILVAERPNIVVPETDLETEIDENYTQLEESELYVPNRHAPQKELSFFRKVAAALALSAMGAYSLIGCTPSAYRKHNPSKVPLKSTTSQTIQSSQSPFFYDQHSIGKPGVEVMLGVGGGGRIETIWPENPDIRPLNSGDRLSFDTGVKIIEDNFMLKAFLRGYDGNGDVEVNESDIGKYSEHFHKVLLEGGPIIGDLENNLYVNPFIIAGFTEKGAEFNYDTGASVNDVRRGFVFGAGLRAESYMFSDLTAGLTVIYTEDNDGKRSEGDIESELYAASHLNWGSGKAGLSLRNTEFDETEQHNRKFRRISPGVFAYQSIGNGVDMGFEFESGNLGREWFGTNGSGNKFRLKNRVDLGKGFILETYLNEEALRGFNSDADPELRADKQKIGGFNLIYRF